MAVNADDVQKLKDKLAKDLEIVRQFEELLARHGINGNGTAAKMAKESTQPTVETDSGNGTVQKGVNTGLAEKLIAIVVLARTGIRLAQIVDSLIESGYAYSTRDNLKAAVSQSLKRLVLKRKIRRDTGLYFPVE